MIKTLRFSLLAALLFCTATTAKAQFFVGAGLFAHQYHDLGVYPGVQARIGFEANAGRYTADIGFNYSPVRKEESFDALFTNPTTLEVQSVKFTQDISVINLYFHGHINLGNEENTFQPGVIAGFSVDEYSLKYTGTPPAGFTGLRTFGDTSFGGGIKVDLGLKGNYRVGHGALFGELLLGLPISGSDSKAPVAARTHYGLQVGYKFYIGNARFAYTGRSW